MVRLGGPLALERHPAVAEVTADHRTHRRTARILADLAWAVPMAVTVLSFLLVVVAASVAVLPTAN